MNTHTTTLPQSVRDALETHQRHRAAFESARDKVARLRGDLQKHTKAADAADAEALSARNDAAALMRDTGPSMKQIRDLKSKERAAYTLAEDYRAIIAEVQLALEEAELEAGLAKGAESAAYSGVATAYAEGLFEALGDSLAPLQQAVQALAHAYGRQAVESGGAPWEQRGYRSALDAALARAHSTITAGVKAAAFDASRDPVLSLAERPNGVADFKVISPATKQMKLAEFARRAVALRTAVRNV